MHPANKTWDLMQFIKPNAAKLAAVISVYLLLIYDVIHLWSSN